MSEGKGATSRFFLGGLRRLLGPARKSSPGVVGCRRGRRLLRDSRMRKPARDIPRGGLHEYLFRRSRSRTGDADGTSEDRPTAALLQLHHNDTRRSAATPTGDARDELCAAVRRVVLLLSEPSETARTTLVLPRRTTDLLPPRNIPGLSRDEIKAAAHVRARACCGAGGGRSGWRRISARSTRTHAGDEGRRRRPSVLFPYA